MIARALMGMNEHAMALNVLRGAYHLARTEPKIWANIGHCLAELWHTEAARDWMTRAARVEPDDVGHMTNLASIYAQMGDPLAAIEWGEKALAIDPESRTAKYNLSLPYLMEHRWPAGWAFYDEAHGTTHQRPQNVYTTEAARWEGLGGNVVIYGEQGLGDAIMFASMIPEAIEDADRVVIDVDLRMVDLFRRSFPKAHVSSTSGGQPLKVPAGWEPDCQIAMGSLGGFYRLQDTDFPGTPYLVPDPDRVLQWEALLARFPKPWIGVGWRGGTDTTGERERSLSLLELLPLFEAMPHATFVALNYQPATGQEVVEFREGCGVELQHWPRATRQGINLDETAGLIGALDAVVSVQTTAVHLAGAMGVPTWCLVPNKPQWRYGRTGERMPWYGAVTLMRQGPKVWTEAVIETAERVKEFLG